MEKEAEILNLQLVAALIRQSIIDKQQLVANKIEEAFITAGLQIKDAEELLNQGLDNIEIVRDFISNPNNILGNERTKHGEIAEQIDVYIRNARDIWNGLKPGATFENVGRTAPEDYLIGAAQVQSKFLNSASKTMDAILFHMDKYPYFAKDSYYVMPKDQYESIMSMLNGTNIEGTSTRTLNTWQELVDKIEATSGRPFSEVVRPSISNYSDVQLG